MEINYLAVVVATVAAFVVSSVWYGVLGSQLARLNDAYADSARPPVWIMLVEFARSLVVAYVLAVLAGLVGDGSAMDWISRRASRGLRDS
jgi:L-asparagine transporter-like permease